MKMIKHMLKITALICVMIGFTACNDDDDSNYKSGAVTTSVSELTFPSNGDPQTFEISSPLNVVWGVKTDADWLTFSQTSGHGNATIQVDASVNDVYEERTATITVFTNETSTDILATQLESNVTIAPDPSEMSEYTSVELTAMMGLGWNAGNSLEAVGGETTWGNPPINKQLIDGVKAAGFNTVRIPIAWSNYIEEGDETYTISAEGFARVEEVVNYVLDNDMFALINIHWDGGWMQPTYADQDYVNDRLSKIWKQIAIHFRNYDYHLVFAGTNEVMVEGDYNTPTEEYYNVQNSFNQTFITAVRSTGGRNAYRYLTVQGFNTNIDHTVNFAVLPEDTIENRMLMEVHYYDPYEFALREDNDDVWQWGDIATDPDATATWGGEDWLETQFQRMTENFVDKGYGVILGEYGAMSRDVEGNDIYRAYYYQKTTESALKHGLVPVIWDNGSTDFHQYGLFNREDGTEAYPDLIDALTNH